MKRICVFCGSREGNNPSYAAAAQALGALLAKENITLVYGGGNVGLMGTLSKAVMQNGGNVIGIIPQALKERELASNDITELRVVGSMHERKALMAGLADGFIALPGGVGTLDEFAEIVTWAQLDFHRKPCGLLNVDGYYRHLVAFFDNAVQEGFFGPKYRSLIIIEKDPKLMLEQLLRFRSPREMNEWVNP